MATVLIVEDEPATAKEIERRLGALGHRVSAVVASSTGAIIAAAAHCPDVVLLDIQIQGELDGVSTAEVLRERFGVPIIFMTADQNAHTFERAKKADPQAYLLKPFDDGALATSVALATNRRRLETRLRETARWQTAALLSLRPRAPEPSEKIASMTTVTAGVAHEINNPLSCILANLDYAAEEIESANKMLTDPLSITPRERREQAERLREAHIALADATEAAHRIKRIIADLRTYGDAVTEERMSVDVRACLEWAIRLAEPVVAPHARLVREIDEVPYVLASAARLGEAFVNLITNAALAIPAGAPEAHEVRITTSTDESGAVVIEITNTGAEYTEEDLKKMFLPLFASHGPGTARSLGLSICHGVVRSIGGSISVDRAPNQGSCVRVVLPALSPNRGSPERISTPLTANHERGYVLIIEDEGAVGASLRRMLEPDHDVVVIQSGHEALELVLGGSRFDAILCDLMMSELTGMDIHAELMARAPSMAARMIFITGGAYTTQASEFLATSTNERLIKPIEPKVLLSMLDRFVRAARAAVVAATA